MYFSGSNNNNNVTKEDSGAVVVTPSGGGGGDQPLDLSVRSSKPSQPLSTTHIVNHHHESNQVQDENRNLIISEEPQTGTTQHGPNKIRLYWGKKGHFCLLGTSFMDFDIKLNGA